MAAEEIGLVFVEAPPVPEHVNFLLYGPPKTGKSTAAATAPAPIMWVNAEGRNALHHARKTARLRRASIFEVEIRAGVNAQVELRKVLQHIRSGAEPRVQTVVVDTLAKIRNALVRQIVTPGARNSLQQYGEVARILREFVLALRDLPVNVVLIAHQDVQDAEGERIVQALIGGALTEEIPGEVDVVAYTHSYKDEESGERRYVGQLVEAKGRIAGDRSGGLGAVRDLDLTEWLETYRRALAADESDLPWSEDFDGGHDPDAEDEAAADAEAQMDLDDARPEAA